MIDNATVAAIGRQLAGPGPHPTPEVMPLESQPIPDAGELIEQLAQLADLVAFEVLEAERDVRGVEESPELGGSVLGETPVAVGDPPRGEADIESTVKTKAGLVDALKASTEYCKKAYAQTDAAAAAALKVFGQDQNRMYALTLNAAHNAEHYGNIVTYLRMKSMVPPSSQPRSGQ